MGGILKLVAWDFDGVLNRGHQGGFEAWQAEFRLAIGADPADFTRFVWQEGRFPAVTCGQRDLLDLLEEWRRLHAVALPARDVLDWWLAQDANLDAQVLAWAAQTPGVIATNNEAHRARHLWDDLGLSRQFRALFASGQMGLRKPDPGFFARIEAWSGLGPPDILLVDDSATNTEAAAARGWQVFHFTDATRDALPEVLGITS